jgi:hypothetical protein
MGGDYCTTPFIQLPHNEDTLVGLMHVGHTNVS